MNRAALHVEEDGHTYTDPDNDTILDSYGSPDIGNDYVECHIGEEGYVFSDVWVFTEDSYGNKKLLVPLWY